MQLFLLSFALFHLVAEAAEPTNEQKAALSEIDFYIEAQRQSIEDYYAQRLALLDIDFQRRLLPFKAAYTDRNIRGSFFAWTTYIGEILRQNGVDLYKDREFLETHRKFRSPGVPTRIRLDQAPKLLAIAEKYLAREINRVNQVFAGQAEQIEKERNYALNFRLAELEEKLKNSVLNPPERKSDGLVSGIVYSDDKAAAYVGSKIIHKGDKIGKIQVVDITPNSIVLEKGGKRWTQKVGEKPSSQW